MGYFQNTMGGGILVMSLLLAVVAEAGVKPEDPKGWREYKWGITKQKAEELGARAFKDVEGTARYGLTGIELLPAKSFWLDLGFYTHTGLSTLMLTREGQDCDRPAYESLLQKLRQQYGKEKESKNLDYPNSYYLSHTWIVGMTKIELHHGCPKPDAVTGTLPTTHLRYEKRFTVELWER